MPILYTEEEIKTAACAKACGNEEIMAIKADYHLHSAFSGDGRASMDEMIQKGISLGLEAMCFTEHMDLDYVYEKPEEEGMFELNTDSYLYDLLRSREKYWGRIKLLFCVYY